MKELNMRVWDNLDKEWFDMDKAVISDGKFFRDWREFEDYISETDITIQCFTGIRDRNGREIYEGDVVKGHWWKKGNGHRHIGKVTYVMNAFKVRGGKQYKGLDVDLDPSYEVIGNIYENAELLSE